MPWSLSDTEGEGLWFMGDCSYVLMEHVEGLISTHSMGRAGSYHTRFKDPLRSQSRLDCFCLRLLFGALKGVNKTPRTGSMPNSTWTGSPPQPLRLTEASHSVGGDTNVLDYFLSVAFRHWPIIILFKKQSNTVAILEETYCFSIYLLIFLLSLSLLGSNLIIFTDYKFHTNTIVGKRGVWGFEIRSFLTLNNTSQSRLPVLPHEHAFFLPAWLVLGSL